MIASLLAGLQLYVAPILAAVLTLDVAVLQ